MKRMIDNKTLSEIEASGGTQWYNHKIHLNNGSSLNFIALRQDALKDGGWPNKSHIAFLIRTAGPSMPDADTSFHILNKHSSDSIEIKYINGSNQVAIYTLRESNIASEEVTPL